MLHIELDWHVVFAILAIVLVIGVLIIVVVIIILVELVFQHWKQQCEWPNQ